MLNLLSQKASDENRSYRILNERADFTRKDFLKILLHKILKRV